MRNAELEHRLEVESAACRILDGLLKSEKEKTERLRAAGDDQFMQQQQVIGEVVTQVEQAWNEVERMRALLTLCRKAREELFQKAARLSRAWQHAAAEVARLRVVRGGQAGTDKIAEALHAWIGPRFLCDMEDPVAGREELRERIRAALDEAVAEERSRTLHEAMQICLNAKASWPREGGSADSAYARLAALAAREAKP